MITVIGSLNMDLFVEAAQMPKQGETLFGQSFRTAPGGKGANQAVAVARLGGKVQMIGCVGADLFGEELISKLTHENVDPSGIEVVDGVATGIASITLTENDNRILVVPGANYALNVERIRKYSDRIQQSKLVVMQLEIPAETVRFVLEMCKSFGVPVLLNPAPATLFEAAWIEYATYITPNELECSVLFGDDMTHALEKYPNKLIVTMGKEGAQYYNGSNHVSISGFPVQPVDTTGAGDTFNGALAYKLGATEQKHDLRDAIAFANAAASISVESLGAQRGMPTLEQVNNRLRNK